MKRLDKNAYQEIRNWMHRNARPVDLALWNYLNENGSREAVAAALSYYQNEDGGFGNGLDADCWNPESSPYATMLAAFLLQKIGFIDAERISHPMVQGIFRFLDSGVHSDREGWFFCIPSNDKYPHAPWWTYSEESNRVQSMGITAGLCSFILDYAAPDSILYEKAIAYIHLILKKIESTEDFGEMGASGLCMLLSDIEGRGLTSEFHCEGLLGQMAEKANRSIERNPEKWASYTPRPSELIWSPESPFYRGNEAIVETELDYLIDTRLPGGVWNITWTWFDLVEKYPKEFAVSENWWKANKAIDKVEFLKSFGRLITD